MSDQTENGPINIPIQSDDDDDAPETPADDRDDVIEIDGDAVEADADITDYEIEETEEPAPVESRAVDPRAVDIDPVVVVPEPPKASEISREAVFDMMNELRHKTEQIARLVDEKTDLYDKVLRKQAEFENFRKRGEREMQEAYVRARADLLTEMLPVLDNFDLALHHAENAGAEVIHEGVQLIYKQLIDTLARLGLDPIDADGQPFDPELHEAVATEQNAEVPDHTVVMVMQRGFKLGDRLLRPARVKVAVQPDAG